MLELFYLEITLFLLIFIGYILKKRNMISDRGQAEINDLVIYVVLPCNILKAFMVKFQDGMLGDILAMLLFSLGIQLLEIAYGRFLYRREPSGPRQCLEYAILSSNGGLLGNPIAEGVFGSYGLAIGSVYLLPMRVLMWSLGVASFSGTTDLRKTLRKTLRHPCVLACLGGILLLVTGFRFPAPLDKTVSYLGSCNTALSMCVIGMILSRMKLADFRDGRVLLYCLRRLILIPAAVYGISLLLPVSPTVRGVAVLMSAMPAAATTSVLAEKYGKTPEFAAKLVIISTMLSLPTIAAWSFIVTL